jgi:hypothetical protein
VIGGALADITVSRLPASIASRIEIDPAAGCWVAGPPHDRDGYAKINRDGLHREVYKLLVGPIDPGLVLDHVRARGCISKACVWPAHLEPVPHRINVLRGQSVCAVNARKTHCGHCGREYDLLNTYWRPGGSRDCRACIRRRVAEYRARQKASTGGLVRLAA